MQLGVDALRKRIWLLAIVGVLAGVYGVRTAWRARWESLHPEAARVARFERIFDAAWSAVDRHYYDPAFDHQRWRVIRAAYRPRVKDAADESILYINILHNMLQQLDTSHLDIVMPPPRLAPQPESGGPSRPAQAKLFGCGGAFLKVDFGFYLAQVRRGHTVDWVVADVRRGSSAERAGLAPGDRLRAMRLSTVRGGCPRARMEALSPGQPPRQVSFDVDDALPSPPLQRVDLPSGVRVLRFDRFDKESELWLAANLVPAPPRGLVLDLRRNTGGEIRIERRVLSRFLSEGRLIGRQVARRRTTDEVTRSIAPRYEGPLAVLMGPGSASAAEISAAALRYHRRAVLVGGETSGSVLASRTFPLPGGGGVQVAVADFRGPDGRRLEGVGVRPDVPVNQTLEAIRHGRDLPLGAAEQALLNGRWRP